MVEKNRKKIGRKKTKKKQEKRKRRRKWASEVTGGRGRGRGPMTGTWYLSNASWYVRVGGGGGGQRRPLLNFSSFVVKLVINFFAC